MNYAEIKYCDIANGTGVRTSLFVSGCTHACDECFNKIAWDFRYGRHFTHETLDEIIESCRPDYIAGLSLLGGEPFEPENQAVLCDVAKQFKKAYPNKTIWCYSGYTYEQLTGAEPSRCRTSVTDEFLGYIDILVDGEYKKDEHDITLRFRGSANQRIIDMNETRRQGRLTLWTDDPIFSTHTM